MPKIVMPDSFVSKMVKALKVKSLIVPTQQIRIADDLMNQLDQQVEEEEIHRKENRCGSLNRFLFENSSQECDKQVFTEQQPISTHLSEDLSMEASDNDTIDDICVVSKRKSGEIKRRYIEESDKSSRISDENSEIRTNIDDVDNISTNLTSSILLPKTKRL
ncbi:hypothetical protein EIN_022970 [Entamoeba invadens IP1]|uniref:hypothetical protein n=1 Tax=Entamoeba invadens IP1 TaxID=370355 RepID=UPI0002C3ED63|nr:hypothetical protein EIN_022970 [Entamoeba invadens IP1]ELP90648.1 hypothetical protein EIN_022970 [Entamoeba invadens IP1]|eukprot:XP_004257419.1 hypothetical protein EIN_022970 [Entamoeba invadens IP1]